MRTYNFIQSFVTQDPIFDQFRALFGLEGEGEGRMTSDGSSRVDSDGLQRIVSIITTNFRITSERLYRLVSDSHNRTT